MELVSDLSVSFPALYHSCFSSFFPQSPLRLCLRLYVLSCDAESLPRFGLRDYWATNQTSDSSSPGPKHFCLGHLSDRPNGLLACFRMEEKSFESNWDHYMTYRSISGGSTRETLR